MEKQRNKKNMFHVFDELPLSYREMMRFDLTKDANLLRRLRKEGYILLAITFALVCVAALSKSTGFASFSRLHWSHLLIYPVLVVALEAVVIFLHEGIHGIFFHYFGRSNVEFGWEGAFAYATCSGRYFDRNSYLVIGLAPLVILSGGSYVALWLLPLGWGWVALATLCLLNTFGAAGDIHVSKRLFSMPGSVYCLDTREGLRIFSRLR